MVEADECTLPSGKMFFQLELESDRPDEAKEALECKLKDIGVDFAEASFGKFKRLLDGASEARISPRLKAVIERDKQ